MSVSRTGSSFPARILLGAVLAICVALGASAGYGYFTLSRLRSEYLSNRARQVASLIDFQARGPGRRNNPAFWQDMLDANFDGLGPSVAFVALLDGSGSVLASRSATGEGFPTTSDGGGIYTLNYSLQTPRQGQRGMSSAVAGWALQVGLFSSDADFLSRQALIQIAVAAVAIPMLLLVAFSLVRILRRFVALKAREESERHLKSMGSMAAVLAHEIRNPLGAMKGLTQLAQEEIPQDHTTQGMLRTVVTEAERLEKLVSDLLNFAQPRQIEMHEFDFSTLVRDLKSMLEPNFRAEGKEVEIRSESGPLWIRSDEDGLRQVLLNVLLNALEFTPRGGAVRIGVQYRVPKKELIVDIDDSGPGLGSDNPEELFEPFTTKKPKGTGLGLAVSKSIVESLGGSIALSNIPAGGARCSIRLPLSLIEKKEEHNHEATP